MKGNLRAQPMRLRDTARRWRRGSDGPGPRSGRRGGAPTAGSPPGRTPLPHPPLCLAEGTGVGRELVISPGSFLFSFLTFQHLPLSCCPGAPLPHRLLPRVFGSPRLLPEFYFCGPGLCPAASSGTRPLLARILSALLCPPLPSSLSPLSFHIRDPCFLDSPPPPPALSTRSRKSEGRKAAAESRGVSRTRSWPEDLEQPGSRAQSGGVQRSGCVRRA